MILLRREIGDIIRQERTAQQRTLRDVAGAASVSLGYLSEIERGTKEPSSEMLAAVCGALDLPLSSLLGTLSERALAIETMSAPVQLPVGAAAEERRAAVRAA